jgi:hypothetical protein
MRGSCASRNLDLPYKLKPPAAYLKNTSEETVPTQRAQDLFVAELLDHGYPD